jgi:hypothetical protein
MNSVAVRSRSRRHAQRGIAALTIVMLLFFVMAMVAAYANRTLIFEQKISANVYRLTKATEAGEGGIEWVIAMANSGRIDGNCASSVNVANNSFRQRYLPQDANGAYKPSTWPKPDPDPTKPATSTPLNMVCFKASATALTCACPTTGDPVLANMTGPTSAFQATFSELSTRPGVVKLSVRGCSNFGSACYTRAPGPSDASTVISLSLALLSGLPSPPVAALTVTGNVNSTVALNLSNVDAGSGITVHAGGNIGLAAGSQYYLPPGAIGSGIVQGDPKLLALGPAGDNNLFFGMFGMPSNTYKNQPAVYQLTNCAAAACQPVSLATAIANNPGQIIYVEGDLTIDAAAATLGTVAQPVLLVVNGLVNFTGAGVTFNGLIFGNNFSWTAAATNSVINGALVVNGDFSAAANANIFYNAAAIKTMNQSYGSLVRIPGSWTNNL